MTKTDQSKLNSATLLNLAYGAPEIVRQRMRTIEALDIKLGEKILDVGCGTGFLSYDMALIVGSQGNITSIDLSAEMVDATRARCFDLPHVQPQIAKAHELPFESDSFDIVTCTQVLLYVPEIDQALEECLRVLKVGGRIAIVETDWQGLVIHSKYPEVSQKLVDAWDSTVANPNLPCKLQSKLNKIGFKGIRAEAIPLLNTSMGENSFSKNSITWLAENGLNTGRIRQEQATNWLQDLDEKGWDNNYFFCLNRFLFIAIK